MAQKCLKNMQHTEETIIVYPSHLVKQCTRCKLKRWVNRNKGAIAINLNKPPERTCT